MYRFTLMKQSFYAILFFSSILIYSMLESTLCAQILHTESFSVILDTTKVFKGSIIPDFKFQNQYYIQSNFSSPTTTNYEYNQGANKFTGIGFTCRYYILHNFRPIF